MAILLLFLLLTADFEAQRSSPATSAAIDVIARTPADQVGEDRARATSSVHAAPARRGDRGGTEALLREIPGLNVNDVQHNPLQGDVSFRGFTLSPLLGTAQGLSVYVDGVRINEPFGDTMAWGILPAGAVERIDLIAGANPAFGLNTLGGTIVMRTRRGGPDAVTLEASGGSFGSGFAGLSGGWTSGVWSSFVSADHLQEDGWRDHSPSRATRAFGSAGWVGARATADFRTAISSSDLTGNGPAPVDLLALDRRAVFTYPDRTTGTTALVSSRATWMLSPQTVVQSTGHLRVIRARTVNGDDSPFEPCDDEPGVLCLDDDEERVLDLAGDLVPPFDAVNNRSRSRQRTAGVAAEWDHRAGRHELLAGASADVARSRYRLDVELAALRDDRRAAPSGTFVRNGRVDLRSDLRTAAFFAGDRIALTPTLDLTLAARYNHASLRLDDQIGTDLDGRHTFGHLNAAVGFVRAFAGGAALFGNIGRSSRIPTPVELTCADPEAPCRLPNAFVSDPPLDPVRTTSLEMGVRRSGTVSWSAALFHAATDDDILFVSSGRARGEGHFENVGRTLRRGVEIAARTASWHLSYALVDATFAEAFFVASPHHPAADDRQIAVAHGDRIPAVPRHVVKAGATGRMGRSSAGIDGRYVSSQFVRGDEANLAEPLSAYWTADARVDREVSSRLSLFAAVENLFNARYATFGLFGDPQDVLGEGFDDPRFVSPGAPRSLRIGARLRF